MPEQAEIIVIGFDFGMKRIGVAVGQSLTQRAKPLTTLQAKDGKPDWEMVQRLIDQWSPNCLLVGIPLNMDGSEQDITRIAKKFARRLKERFSLAVIGVDERLTTVEARANVFDQGGYKKLKKSEIDAVAAKLIVEQWLADQTSGKEI